jgi:AcrR family transcriptional regulator
MTDQNQGTKLRILEVARVLFAEKGFEGTSVRDIAAEADVNVASLNYHFLSKDNLFLEVLRAGYAECSDQIRSLYVGSGENLEETLVGMFRYFLDKSHDLISHFKMMMSRKYTHFQLSEGTEDQFMGPPGGKVIADAIVKEIGQKISEKDLHWGLKCLFSHVIHMSIMHHCCFKDNQIPFTTPKDIEDGIRRLCQSVIRDLKEK